MALEPELAKKVLQVYSSKFKDLLQGRSLFGVLSQFDPGDAKQITDNLDRHYAECLSAEG